MLSHVSELNRDIRGRIWRERPVLKWRRGKNV